MKLMIPIPKSIQPKPMDWIRVPLRAGPNTKYELEKNTRHLRDHVYRWRILNRKRHLQSHRQSRRRQSVGCLPDIQVGAS